MQAADSSLQVRAIEPSSLKRIEAGGVVYISRPANPQFQEDEVLRPQHLHPEAKDLAHNGPTEGVLRRGVPCPQPVDLHAPQQDAQPDGAGIAALFEHAGPAAHEGLAQSRVPGGFQEEHQIDVLGGPGNTPGFEGGPAG